ncbi:MAG: hypothetical protein K8R87_09870, partial [Verrucomicrobia bacterium]|nr:hypothetical protein [Verrucomicrobiota bacterium]
SEIPWLRLGSARGPRSKGFMFYFSFLVSAPHGANWFGVLLHLQENGVSVQIIDKLRLPLVDPQCRAAFAARSPKGHTGQTKSKIFVSA